jgi:tetratricopeptide (TPR) repeat protein
MFRMSNPFGPTIPTPDAPMSATQAYRKDIGRQPHLDATEEEQGAWIMVATMLEHAMRHTDSDGRAEAVQQAADLTIELVGEAEIERVYATDPPFVHADRAAGVVRILIERMEEAGCLYLARVAIDALRIVVPFAVVDDGRLHAQRCRLAWKQGDLDEARDGYDMLEDLGEEYGEKELVIRAWAGRSALAHQRGNFPEVQSIADRVIEMSGGEYPELAAHGYENKMMAAAMKGDFDVALDCAAQLRRLAKENPKLEPEVLVQIGQLLVEAGQHRAAFVVLSRVLRLGVPRRMALPAASGLALAAAALHDVETVRWISRQIAAAGENPPLPGATAQALVEAATALYLVGDVRAMTDVNTHAIRLAKAHGFHQITFRAESLTTEMERQRDRAVPSLSATATDIVAECEGLEIPDLAADSVLALDIGRLGLFRR